MLTKYLLPALAAIGSVTAATDPCASEKGFLLNSQADATSLISNCKKVTGDVILGPNAGQAIDITGPSEITGDLTVLNNGVITSFRSDSLQTIGGTFTLQNLTLLTSLTMPPLTKVDTILFQSLPALGELNIGPPGITFANVITVSDTFLKTLNGLDVSSARTINIDNNRRLVAITTSLGNLTDVLRISANHPDLEVSMPNLKWIANMTIANVSTFEIPSLAVVNGSARFDFNKFTSFNAPNLTHTESGDISFVGNADLKDITMPALTSIGGGLLIANNTALQSVKGFEELKTVGGALKLRGNFTTIDFPALDDVKGAFDISSTADISKSCDEFQKLSSGGQIQGTFACTSDNELANSDTGTGTSGTTGGGDKKDAAAGLSLNTVLLGLSAVAGIAMMW